MGEGPRIYDILRTADDATADLALVAGVLEVEPMHQRRIVEILLERGHEAGLKSIPMFFDRLDEIAQYGVIAASSKLSSSLRSTIRSSDIQTRVNTVEIIRRSGNLRLAYLAAHAVHDGSPQVRAIGAQTLKELSDRHCRAYEETTNSLRDAAVEDGELARPIVQTLKILRDERQFLNAALMDALRCYESHHRPEILQAAMLMADELEEGLFQHSTITRGKLTHAMLDVFGNIDSTKLAPFTYVAMCYPELRRRLVAAIATRRDAEFFSQLIRHYWLARDPAIRRGLLSIKSVAWLDDGLEATFSLPPDVAKMAPPWILALGISPEQKVSSLLNFLLLDNADANRAAIWALTQIDTPSSTLGLQSALDHEDPDVVAIAQREVSFRIKKDRFVARKPRSDRPPDWCGLIDRACIDENFDDLWHHFERLHPVAAKSAGHHALQYIPGFSTQVQVRLLSQNAVDRLRGLRLIIMLHLAKRFANDIFNIANDASVQVRSTAMIALGQVGDPTSRRILERAINDDDQVVQTAAIDALDAMNAPRRGELVTQHALSDNAEVRAAAIRVLLRQRVAAAASNLFAMMKDERPDHRCAALWVVDQMRLSTIVDRVQEVADHDRDSRIARIAQHVAKRLRRQETGSPRNRQPQTVEVQA